MELLRAAGDDDVLLYGKTELTQKADARGTGFRERFQNGRQQMLARCAKRKAGETGLPLLDAHAVAGKVRLEMDASGCFCAHCRRTTLVRAALPGSAELGNQ